MSFFGFISDALYAKKYDQNKDVVKIFKLNNPEYVVRGDVEKPIYYFTYFEKKPNKVFKILMCASSYSRLGVLHTNVRKLESTIYMSLWNEITVNLARPDFDKYDAKKKAEALEKWNT